MTPTLPPAGHESLFGRLFSGPRGIDPYAFAVSDVYQDLFGEGIYTGKGIYDVDAFERALGGRVPENSLLSHDLFEGIFARAGLLTDVELFEQFPSHYEVAAARQHRWARGDWQLLRWLPMRVPDASGSLRRNPLPPMGLWKILDNIRRSLVAPFSVLTLIVSATLAGAIPIVWTTFVLATIAVPRFLPVVAGAIPLRRRTAKRSVLQGFATDVVLAAANCAASIILLAHQAWLMSDAIVRTLGRVYGSGRKLLEWTTSAQARSEYDLAAAGFVRRNAAVFAVAVAAAGFSAALRPGGVAPAAVLFFVLWTISPLVAWELSRHPAPSPRETLSAADAAFLRATARRTWGFFERFAAADDHQLPPDNFQVDPKPVVAHRTSPTNIGLSLLATLAAHDFGWIGATETAERLDATLSAAASLERFRGHLFNWYDTQTLAPLEPRYVSTVDSGNLVAHLLVVKQACLEIAERPQRSDVVFAGLRDTVRLLRESADAARFAQARLSRRRMLQAAIGRLEERLAPLGPDESLADRLDSLAVEAASLSEMAGPASKGEETGSPDELALWCQALQASIASHRRDIVPAADEASPGAVSHMPEVRRLARAATLVGPGGLEESLSDDELRLAERELSGRDVESPGAGEPGPAEILARRLVSIAVSAESLASAMDFSFLFDRSRKLFSIGYRLSDGLLDTGFYDLLASEARLASFLAIARGEVPVAHWFHLGRPLTPVGKGSALVSWSGSMFEYLMPDLVLDAPTNSLLELSTRLVVGRQIRYGSEHDVPWGVSESGFNGRDVNLAYQYSSFGVSGLGLKRGLSEDLVIAPYATALAAMVEPSAAAKNFRALTRVGGLGEYGYFEAIDYTPSRLPESASHAVVQEYMAHHQGMTLVALANVICGWTMRRRFHSEPLVQSAELLLQERTPRDVAVSHPRAEEVGSRRHVRDFVTPVLRRFQSPHDPTPRAHLLSNGRYSVMVTAAGSGYSRFEGSAVTRWREDPTRDCWGSYVFLRDVQSGKVWSAGHQPSGVEPDSYDVAFYEDRVEIRRRDGSLSTMLEVVVSAETDAELRQVSITNLGSRVRELEITSYAELVLGDPRADDAHPAFSNLFVETEFVPGLDALVATRRPRSPSDPRLFAAHVAVVEGASGGAIQFETDRARFIGRSRDLRTAAAVHDGVSLSNTVGPVLDPIFSLRRRVTLAPGGNARLTFSTIVAPTREKLLETVDRCRDPSIFERTVALAWTQAQVELGQLRVSADEAHLFQRLATRLVYSDPTLRAPAGVLARNRRGASALWPYGISGDRPIVLLRIDQAEDRDIFAQLLRAREYWRQKGLLTDLVVLNEEGASYSPELQPGLETMLRTSGGSGHEDSRRAGVYLLQAEQVPPENRDALAAAARIVLLSRNGSLADQVVRFLKKKPTPHPPSARRPSRPSHDAPPPRPPLQFWNGTGGFSDDGSEYVTILERGQSTPAPWSNVVANPNFGFLVTESGSGFTWAGNSHENQLTPWSNDAVSDGAGEAIFVRDEETGEVWTPTALPIREDSPYLAVHGQGYSRFEHESHELALELTVCADPEDAVKVSRLKIENRGNRARSLSVTFYAEWVLGASRSESPRFVVTSFDAETNSLQARNSWNEDYPDAVAFAALDAAPSSYTADRTEFLGRNGSPALPSGLAPGLALSGRTGAGLDPCAALQVRIALPPKGRGAVRVLFGQGANVADARRLVAAARAKDFDATLRQIRRFWDGLLGGLQIKTPDASLDLFVNRWLLYQALSCRLWGRSAFYQSGGAYGFRDQLQDSLAFAVTRRDLLREQILRAAARQFVDGDVQHWWHPPTGRGVRTRISDDALWLPFSVARYLDVTGDGSILDAPVPFLEGEPLKPGEDERYFLPTVSSQSADVFEHCARALDRALAAGPHGLPLMGTGDWNDGMNRVGPDGKGESVWLAWFLRANLEAFAPIAEGRGEGGRNRAVKWRERLSSLDEAIEKEAWDGDWYRRAYFDDGTPLGSALNDECRIDSIAQSWAVIAGGRDRERARRAMKAVDQQLVRRSDGLALLFTPPFDRGAKDPGYIKAYPPGVRENGGQYNHAALWAVVAFAELGDGDRAGELLSVLNPINHTSTRQGQFRYRVEPYVVAGDVYSDHPHVGRGGWTWYTGSAGWMYRAAVEWVLGVRLSGNALRVEPCIPRGWRRYQVTFTYHSTRYQITVENPRGVSRGVAEVRLDGRGLPLDGGGIPLVDDGGIHRVDVLLG
jgi:cyclic beta-1,2-glucan synthetase